jgi:hypothetical protein
LKHVRFVEGQVRAIDLVNRRVIFGHGLDDHAHEVEFDQLVLALGSVTQFFGLPGVEENALTMKSLSDAVKLRNRLIAVLEAADTECSAGERKVLLSVAVAGAGFAGVETLASINDFLKSSLRYYPNLRPEDLSLTLIHPGDVILPELSPRLGKYAQRKLETRCAGSFGNSGFGTVSAKEPLERHSLRQSGLSEVQFAEAIAAAALANFLCTAQFGLSSVPEFPPLRTFDVKILPFPFLFCEQLPGHQAVTASTGPFPKFHVSRRRPGRPTLICNLPKGGVHDEPSH